MISGLPVPEKQVIINNNRRTLKTMMNELWFQIETATKRETDHCYINFRLLVSLWCVPIVVESSSVTCKGNFGEYTNVGATHQWPPNGSISCNKMMTTNKLVITGLFLSEPSQWLDLHVTFCFTLVWNASFGCMESLR
jgi:hypothetical protein